MDMQKVLNRLGTLEQKDVEKHRDKIPELVTKFPTGLIRATILESKSEEDVVNNLAYMSIGILIGIEICQEEEISCQS